MGRRIALAAMSMPQKFRSLHQVGIELVAAGAELRVWTDSRFKQEVEAMGAQFADIFDPLPLAAIDDASLPVPSRYVTFAAARATALSEAVGEWGAEVIVYDSFTVIGVAVGRRLGIPWVPVFSGHLIDGAAMRREVAGEPRVNTDPRCAAAIAQLADEFGMAGVTPFSYFAEPSPWLNVACEPREWLDDAALERYQPLACFGKLPASLLPTLPANARSSALLRIYAAFGTVVWWYWSREASAVLEAVAEAAGDLGAEVVMGLGGGSLPAGARERLEGLGAVVRDFADQTVELARADLFITHAGASSVHEAIAAAVPMLVLPFSADQPTIAARCKSFGIATSLANDWAPHRKLGAGTVRSGIEGALSQRHEMAGALRRAREWELSAANGRAEVARRIIELDGSSPPL
jgi:UDP:flavonoid glycosyltransferase YjiC (YdhE family)